MERTSVQKLARMLRVLVMITFVCNLIALLLVPGLVALGELEGMGFGDLLQMGSDPHEPFSPVLFMLLMWPEIFRHIPQGFGNQYVVLTLFLLLCGICTAVILWQAKRVLGTILKGDPFVMDNAANLRRAAVCCFLISGMALVRLIWGFAYYRSVAPLLTYNALFVPIFLMGGLLFLVMSALFRQAAELKAENDLTI